jgi:hypothetical protein
MRFVIRARCFFRSQFRDSDCICLILMSLSLPSSTLNCVRPTRWASKPIPPSHVHQFLSIVFLDLGFPFVSWPFWTVLSSVIPSKWFIRFCLRLFYFIQTIFSIPSRLCGLVVRVSCYSSRSPGFDFRPYQIFWEAVCLERGPLRLVSINEALFERKYSCSGLETRD